jgi:thiamine pyrophosphate-dependent acetolactate synthase large subunit-like protein
MLLLGGVGPIDAAKRRPWVDWIHTSRDLGALVRGYTKWDDQPGSVPAALEAILRAHRIMMTLAAGPVYVSLDAALQEEDVPVPIPLPELARYQPADRRCRPHSRCARRCGCCNRQNARADDRPRNQRSRRFQQRASHSAERIGAAVLSDIKTGATFPTQHRLHPFPPSSYVTGDATRLITDADVILSLDWIDLGGTLRQACGGELPQGRGHPLLARPVCAYRSPHGSSGAAAD